MISRRSLLALGLKKRRGNVGPSEVIIVIMALTGSVVLASGVVLYGTTLFQGGAQQEAITVSGIKMWVHGTDANGLTWGAFSVRNSGDKVLSVDRIVVRGTDVPFAQWYVDVNVTSVIIQQPMLFTGWAGSTAPGSLQNSTTVSCIDAGADLQIRLKTGLPGEEGDFCANPAAGPIGLDPGQAAIIYFRVNNGTISSVDGGATTSVSVFAGKTGAPQSISIGSKL